MPAPTFLDLAASIDNDLKRNIRYPSRDIVFVDSPFAASILDKYVNASATGGNMLVTLPDATTCKGMPFGVKKTDASTNTVTVQSAGGGQTIDGAASKVLVAQNDFLIAVSDGTNYKIYAITISPAATGGAIFYQIEKVVKTNGIATLVPVDGTLLNFTVAVDGECSFWAAGAWSGNQIFAGGSLNFRIDGVDYAPETFSLVNGAGSDRINAQSLSPHISLFLTAGPHTVELVASESGISLNASAGTPLTLSVLFPGSSASVASPTPKAATLVVDPTPGIGDYTTIQNALNALVALGGGYILIREGSYAENLVMPDCPAVLRGVGDNTVINLGVAAGAAFSVSHDQPYVFEDMRVLGDGVAAQIVLTVPATVTGTKKIILNRVNSYDSVKTIVSNSGATTPLIEIKSSALRGWSVGWASAGGGTLILTDLAGTFGSVTGATTGTLITRNSPIGTVAVSNASVIEGARRLDNSTSSTDAYAAVAPTITNPNGLIGVGTIQNTHATRSLTIKETVIDANGNTASLETVVPALSQFLLDTLTGFVTGGVGTAYPPYVSYKAEVKSTTAGQPATYLFNFLSRGAI